MDMCFDSDPSRGPNLRNDGGDLASDNAALVTAR